MRKFKISSNYVKIFPLLITVLLIVYFSGCSNNTTSPNYGTDQQYMDGVITGGSQYSTEEDNLMYAENSDLNDGGAVGDNGGGPFSPLDTLNSLIRWGRIVESVNINIAGTFSGDTLYTATVTRTITGHYRIIGIKGGLPDSVNKPYTEVLNRVVAFKRIARTVNPHLNWRLYQVSCLSGATTSPQNGNSYSQITAIVAVVNGVPKDTLLGPDFTNAKFTTKLFGGTGIPEVGQGDNVTIYVTVNSTEQNNYVAWHWMRNTFGFHRVPFTFVSAVPNLSNGWTVLFQKNFTVWTNHPVGVFSGYINASTHESLWDDDITKFASTEVGIPYRVTH